MPSEAQREAKEILAKLNPDQRNFARAVAEMRVENKTLRGQIAAIKQAYDELWVVLISLLNRTEGKEIRLSEEELMQFKHEYRIEQKFSEEEKMLVLKLKTLTD